MYGFAGSIAPGVVRSALHQDVARSQKFLALVHQRIYLTRQDDCIVDRGGFMKSGMSRVIEVARVAFASVVVRWLALQYRDAGGIGRVFDNSEDRSVGSRR